MFLIYVPFLFPSCKKQTDWEDRRSESVWIVIVAGENRPFNKSEAGIAAAAPRELAPMRRNARRTPKHFDYDSTQMSLTIVDRLAPQCLVFSSNAI